MHFVFALILVLSAVCDGQQLYGCYINRNETYSGSYGTILSPNYPHFYPHNANCIYTINANEASNITLTFQALDIEFNSVCTFDWVQISCKSHSIGLPTRYCGPNTPLNSLTLSPCKQVEVLFHTDAATLGSGFSIRYQVNDIDCPDNCTLITNATRFVCSCGDNDTDVAIPTAPPSRACSSGCYLSSGSSSLPYCICQVSYALSATCPPGCSVHHDSHGHRSCDCRSTTTLRCASGCYRRTDSRGTSICSCPLTTARPLHCGYGCYQDSDKWGRRFCNCPPSTRPPLYCSSPCYTRTGPSGYQYCYCPTAKPPTTPSLPPCFYPCYYTYDSLGSKICYCQPTTATPLSVCGNRNYNGAVGSIHSPYYSLSGPNSAHCTYIVNANVPSTIILTFSYLDMASSQGCSIDWVQITCKTIGNSTKYCSDPHLSITLSPCDQVEVIFHSDKSLARTSFTIDYQVKEIGGGEDTDLSEGAKAGIGLGVGLGGFFLILVFSCIVYVRRSGDYAARNEPRHGEGLLFIWSVIRVFRRSGDDNDRLHSNSRDDNHGATSAEGFTNPLVDNLPRDPPPYRRVEEASDNNTHEDTIDVVLLIA